MANLLVLAIKMEQLNINMKKKFIILISIFATMFFGIYFFYKIDKRYWMPNRVKKETWMWDNGYRIHDFIGPNEYILKGDTMCFIDGEKCIIKYQFLDYLFITNMENTRIGEYSILDIN
jgi:hypothetical protein